MKRSLTTNSIQRFVQSKLSYEVYKNKNQSSESQCHHLQIIKCDNNLRKDEDLYLNPSFLYLLW